MSCCADRALDGDFNGGSIDCSGKEGNRTEICSAQVEKEKKKRGFSAGDVNGASEAKKAAPFSFRKLQRFFTRNGLCCCLCPSSPQMLVKNPSGDSTTPAVRSYGNLRSMIEGNDFYSNGCNSHLGN